VIQASYAICLRLVAGTRTTRRTRLARAPSLRLFNGGSRRSGLGPATGLLPNGKGNLVVGVHVKLQKL